MQVFGRQHSEYEREELGITNKKMEGIKKMADTHLIVAALTFAAGFTLPGGYNGADGREKGTAILGKDRTFQMFMMTNIIAMVSSVSAVFLYFTASLYTGGHDLHARYKTAMYLVLVGFVAMVCAFMAGAHAVLENIQVSMAITTVAIGSICLLFYIPELKSMGLFRHVRNYVVRLIYGRDTRSPSEIVEENRRRHIQLQLQ